ncbi:DNA-packaging protein [Joostella sp.]|uniref:DNA-packaging protein n=1 Tax=Joostella sp. TaxID=2231138 RepID=UPI003A8CF7EB
MGEIGNQYWKLRSKDGRDKIFKTPEDLSEAINDYFQWCLLNPILESQVVKGRFVEEDEKDGEVIKIVKNFEIVEVPKMRPFTIEGMCNYLDISVEGFKLYEKRNDFIGVTTRARQIIYNQKFEGAASNQLNPNIIARDLGLIDKKDLTTDGDKITMTDEERDARIKELIKKAKK